MKGGFGMTTVSILQNKKPNIAKLKMAGILKKDGQYTFAIPIMNGQFQLLIVIAQTGEMTTQVIDAKSGEEYTLHLTKGPVGPFIATVRQAYEEVLAQIEEEYFEPDIFKSREAQEIISYVRNTYGDELEFLWERFPNNAVWRRRDSKKWYAALMTIKKRKLGLDSDAIIEIIDLRMNAAELEKRIDNEKYFPGYHMNKKHWLTICLDGTVPLTEIYRRIDDSYQLAVK